MLPRPHRITKREDFEAIYRQGRIVSSPNVVVAFRDNGQKTTRIGVVAGVKFSRLAVKRNRIKRQIREIMRNFYPLIKPGLDIVVTARKEKGSSKVDLESQELEKMIESALQRAKIISQ